MKFTCAECGSKIQLSDDVIVGEIVSCPDCGVEFEVIEFKNEEAQIKLAENVGEDWGE